jgi:hypothetical protein
MMVYTAMRVCLVLGLSLLTGCAGGSSDDSANNLQNDNGPTASAAGGSVRIAWDATDPSARGYYVHYGTESPNVPGSCAYEERTYFSLASLANASSPTATLSGLTSGKTYYFAVSAINDDVEGACSNEISKPL